MASMLMVSWVSAGSSAAKVKTPRLNDKNNPMRRSNFIRRAQLNKTNTDLPTWICREPGFTQSLGRTRQRRTQAVGMLTACSGAPEVRSRRGHEADNLVELASLFRRLTSAAASSTSCQALLVFAEFNFVTKLVEKIGELKSRPFLGVFVNSIGSRGDAQFLHRLPARVLLEVLVERAQQPRGAVHHAGFLLVEINVGDPRARQFE